jgi:hypothetical protein
MTQKNLFPNEKARYESKRKCIKNKKASREEKLLVRIIGLEPTRLAAPDPKSGMSTNFTISA